MSIEDDIATVAALRANPRKNPAPTERLALRLADEVDRLYDLYDRTNTALIETSYDLAAARAENEQLARYSVILSMGDKEYRAELAAAEERLTDERVEARDELKRATKSALYWRECAGNAEADLAAARAENKSLRVTIEQLQGIRGVQ